MAINSLVAGKFKVLNFPDFRISVIDGWGISCEFALRWMSLNLTDDKSILVQGMAWCHRTTSHYPNQCWPRTLSPYGVTRSNELTCSLTSASTSCAKRKISTLIPLLLTTRKNINFPVKNENIENIQVITWTAISIHHAIKKTDNRIDHQIWTTQCTGMVMF